MKDPAMSFNMLLLIIIYLYIALFNVRKHSSSEPLSFFQPPIYFSIVGKKSLAHFILSVTYFLSRSHATIL